MSFTRKQQGLYREMVAKAWARHCRLNGSPIPDHRSLAAAKRQWYEDELEAATGKRSTTDCDPKRDFEDAMEHFEMLAEDGIYWATRKWGADARRILHTIREVVREADVDEDYMRRIARRSLGLREWDGLPDLSELSYDQLRTVMGELKRFLTRGGRPHVKQLA